MGSSCTASTINTPQSISLLFMESKKQIAINCFLHHRFARDGKFLFALIENYKIENDDCYKYSKGSLAYRMMWFARDAQRKHPDIVCNYEINDVILILSSLHGIWNEAFYKYFLCDVIFYCLRKYGYRRINHMKHYYRVELDYYKYYLLLCKQEPVYAIFSKYGRIQNGVRDVIKTKGSAMALMCYQRIASILFLIGEQTWIGVVNPFVMLFCNDYLVFIMCKFL